MFREAAQRSVAASVLRACGALSEPLGDVVADPRLSPAVVLEGREEAQRALRRARRAAASLRVQLPGHSRVVRMADRAVTRCDEAIGLVLRKIPTNPGYDLGEWGLIALGLDRAIENAVRAARAILVELDPGAFALENRKAAGS